MSTLLDTNVLVEGLALPEGTVVTVLTPEEEPAVKLPPALEQELLEAIDEADREAGGAGPEFLEGLRRHG
jgi:hypothetical protein